LKLFVFISALFSLRGIAQEKSIPLIYQLEMESHSIHVNFLYLPIEKDSTVFIYGQPAFGGQTDILDGLRNLHLSSGGKISLDSAKRRIIIYFRNADTIRISYDILDTRVGNSTKNQLFRPMITPDYLFIHGVNLFLTPQFRKEDQIIHVSLEWKRQPPFPLFYTFDPENDGSHHSVTTVDSISLRFITGANDLFIKRFRSESGTNYLVLRSGGMKQEMVTEIEKFYIRYNSQLRRYWKDTRIIEYSLVLQPFIGVDHNISGVSFGNGFIGKYNKADSIVQGYRQFVIAHEMGHYYLGDVVAFSGEDMEGQWFDEGFNDYTTLSNLTGAGYLTTDDFEKEFNRIFLQLYGSKIKNTPNNKIFENFWKLGDYQKLPYWRGCIYAFYLDNQIALATGQQHSIRDLMLDLKQLVMKRENKMFTNEEFINAVSKFLKHQQVQDAFIRYIEDGNSINFNNSMIIPSIRILDSSGIPVIHIVDKAKFLRHYMLN
jgi:predicted metalloprotease with PDZ domain